MNQDHFYKQRAWRRLGFIASFLVVVVVVGWYFYRTTSSVEVVTLSTSVEQAVSQGIKETFSAPPPLLGGDSSQSSTSATSRYTLTRGGVITQTNVQRAANGDLPPFAENATLDEIATLRLQDMFAKQYFAHISPSSSSAITVASSVGYSYVSLGENLALGNFDGDTGVVVAWMNSPGHRANILNTHYTQIGVAVGKGNFQGDAVWIAVQVFGRPASDCPKPSASLKASIDTGQAEASTTLAQLQTMRSQLDAMQPKSGDAYDQAAQQYNALLTQYNGLITTLKSEIEEYNNAAVAYNQCIAD